MKPIRTKLTRLGLGAVALLVLPAPSAVQAQPGCPTAAALADPALPAKVGTSALVTAMVRGANDSSAQPLSAGFEPQKVEPAIAERLIAASTCPSQEDRKKSPGTFACEYRGRQTGSLLEIDMHEGRLTYINPMRRPKPGGPGIEVTGPKALGVGSAVLEGLGVPRAEMNLGDAVARGIALTSAPTGGGPSTTRRIEMLAWIPRKVGGYPVIGSYGKVVVDGALRPARVHAVWPDFTPDPGLSGAKALSRSMVIQGIVDEIVAAAACGKISSFVAQVGWIEAALDGASDAADSAAAGRYIPGLRILAKPPSTAEDSGAEGGFVLDFVVPLVGPGTVSG